MREIRIIFILFANLTYHATNPLLANSIDLHGGVSGDISFTSNDIVFAHDVNISDLVTITNHGILGGAFHAKAGTTFAARTTRATDAVFFLEDGATLIQRISSAGEMFQLDVRGGVYRPTFERNFQGGLTAMNIFTSFNSDIVLTVDTDMLEISLYMHEISMLAEKLRINGSLQLNILDFDGRALDFSMFNGLVFQSVGQSYDYMWRYVANGQTVKRIRETDYTKIFGPYDSRAVFLNSVRGSDPDSKILANLDNAQTLGELNRRMNSTMFFNPLVLNRGLEQFVARHGGTRIAPSGLHIGAETEMHPGGFGNRATLGTKNLDVWVYVGDMAVDDNYRHGAAMTGAGGIELYKNSWRAGLRGAVANWEGVLIMNDGGNPVTQAQSRLLHAYFGNEFDATENFGAILRANFLHSSAGDFSRNIGYVSVGGRAQYYTREMGITGRYGFYAVYNIGGGEEENIFTPEGIPAIEFGAEFNFDLPSDGLTLGVQLSNVRAAANFRIAF